MAREDARAHNLLSAQKLSSQSGATVYPLEDYMEMSGEYWVNTPTRTVGTRAQQINHWQLHVFVLTKRVQSAATLWRRDIDLVHYISLVVQLGN